MSLRNNSSPQLIPAIDLRGGRCVRLFQGRYDAETVYDPDPVQAAARVSVGAALLHVVDLDGARGSGEHREIMGAIIGTVDCAVQCGGGVRSAADIDALLSLGASRVVIGSLAVEAKEMVASWLAKYGPSRIVVALDVRPLGRDEYRLATRGWQNDTAQKLDDVLNFYWRQGVQHFLCTDISRDGTLAGPNLRLYGQLCSNFPGLALQASGGVRDRADLAALAAVGVRRVIVGRSVLEGSLAIREAACPPCA